MVDNPPSTNWRGRDWSNARIGRLYFYTKVKSMKAKAIQPLSTRKMIGVPAINESNRRDLSF